MLSRFWEGLGKGLADRWLALGSPALLFWAGGLACRALTPGGVSDLRSHVDAFTRQAGGVQAAILAGALVVVGASALLVERLTFPALRLLEGYWPQWLAGPRVRLLARRSKKVAEAEQRWEQLAELIDAESASSTEVDEYTGLEQTLRRVPPSPSRRMPTRVGDILRSAEGWPYEKYGLDVVVCWPRHWLVLPEPVRQTLSDARTSLDRAVAAWLWGAFFVGFAVWAWPAALIGPLVAVTAARFWVPARAEIFGDLVEASFDLYRWQLYDALRWPPPTNPAEETERGRAITSYLARGSDLPEPKFTEG